MKKRITSIMLAGFMLIGCVTSAACGDKESTGSIYGTESAEEILTREQWVIGLGSMFGMNEYQIEEPYFTDVEQTAEVYPFLQSCAEWGIFEEVGVAFEPEANVTREYAIQTAVMAAEVLEHTIDGNIYDACVPYAVEQGILESDKAEYLEEYITYAEGQEILDWAVAEYQNREFVEYANVELEENLIDMSDMDIEIEDNGDYLTIPADTMDNLHTGDVFIIPGDVYSPDGIAKKVVSVTVDAEGNQIVETTEPEIEEIYEEIEFAVRAIPEAEDVIVAEGVTIATVEDSSTVYARSASVDGIPQVYTGNNVDGQMENCAKKGLSLNLEVDIEKGKPSYSGDFQTSLGNFALDAEKWDTPDQEKIGELLKKSSLIYQPAPDKEAPKIDKIENKFEGGYEITGAIRIENLYIDMEKSGSDEILLKINYDATTELSIKGEINEEFSIATVPVKTPIPGVTVAIKIGCYIDANGELQFTFKVENVTTVGYANGNVKKVSTTSAMANEVKVAIELEPGVSLAAEAQFFGVRIIDAKVKAGVKIDCSSAVEERIVQEKDKLEKEAVWILKVELLYPLVTIQVGNSEEDKDERESVWSIKFTWEVVGENGAIQPAKKTVYEEEFILFTTKEDAEDTEQVEDTETEAGYELIGIDTYALGMQVGEFATISVTSVPEGYSASDLRWTSDNAAVATVSDGVVTAVGEGVTTVTVSTSDGVHQMTCTVVVDSDEQVEFNSL